MAYADSNGHVLDDVTCPVFLFVTQCVFHATFRIDDITWKYRKTANIGLIEKNLFITLLTAICIVSHIENSKNDKGYYRAMHFSAKRGIAIACRLSVRLSVRL